MHINVCLSGVSILLVRCLQKKFGITSSLGSSMWMVVGAGEGTIVSRAFG